MDKTAAKNEKEATELKGAIKASKYVGGDGDGERPLLIGNLLVFLSRFVLLWTPQA